MCGHNTKISLIALRDLRPHGTHTHGWWRHMPSTQHLCFTWENHMKPLCIWATCVVHVGILAHTLHMYAALITCLPHAYSTQRKAHRGAHNINILAICTTGVEIKHGCMKERLRGELWDWDWRATPSITVVLWVTWDSTKGPSKHTGFVVESMEYQQQLRNKFINPFFSS